MTTDILTAPAEVRTPEQRRLDAFLSPAGADVFHSIVHQNDIWKDDPFDVETIHEEARAVFTRLLNRAAAPPALASGRILLLLGESGSGKTHLMRAFRRYAHEDGVAYCGYLQMTSTVGNYARYVLGKLIEALDQPYHDPDVSMSGLMRLSGALFDSLLLVDANDRAQFREGFLPPALVIHSVNQYADCALRDGRFTRIDVDLIRALLFLQRDDPTLKNRVLKYLRCEDLGAYDRDLLGGVVPRNQEESPLEMIGWLGRTMEAVQSAPLVLCFDQLEDIVNQDALDKDAGLRFRKVMDSAVAITDAVPSSIVVISCLEDYYKAFRAYVALPKLDRIEKDPEPVQLKSGRSALEVETLVSLRLQCLYGSEGAPFDESAPTAPFTKDDLKPLENLRTRDVLDFCRLHRERCVAAGKWLAVGPTPPPPPPPPTLDIEQRWNDFRAAFPQAPPDEEADLTALLAWGVRHCSDEIDSGHWFEIAAVKGRMAEVEVHGADNVVARFVVGVCNKGTQRGALLRQIKEVEERASESPAVIVRSTAFPAGRKADANVAIGRIVARGGRRALVEDTDWRTMLALRAFRDREKDAPELAAWLRQTRPLTSLKSMQTILALDALPRGRPPAVAPAPSPPPAPVKTPTPPQPAPPRPARCSSAPAATVQPLQ